jgi:hypothetical protein
MGDIEAIVESAAGGAMSLLAMMVALGSASLIVS